jgi:uncharacterized protein YraI
MTKWCHFLPISKESSWCRTLMATDRSWRKSQASQTEAMPTRPSSHCTEYRTASVRIQVVAHAKSHASRGESDATDNIDSISTCTRARSEARGANGGAKRFVPPRRWSSHESPDITEAQRPALVGAGRAGFTNRELYH